MSPAGGGGGGPHRLFFFPLLAVELIILIVYNNIIVTILNISNLVQFSTNQHTPRPRRGPVFLGSCITRRRIYKKIVVSFNSRLCESLLIELF